MTPPGHPSRARTRRRAPGLALLLALSAAVPPGADLLVGLVPLGAGAVQAQELPALVVARDGDRVEAPVAAHRGYAALPVGVLLELGWEASVDERTLVDLRHPAGSRVVVRSDTPFLHWDDRLVQLADAPYRFGGELHLPLQVFADLLPFFLPEVYAYDPEERLLRVSELGAGIEAPATRGDAEAATAGGEAPRVVVIDPGHGGRDHGATGPGGVREKDVALAVALALRDEFRKREGIEARLTREDDVHVPLWERGEMATEWKGERPGVFLSIHANALPDRAHVRGFETYFLSEARTEHERRVAAMENASLVLDPPGEGSPARDPLLEEILMDLRSLDHQHWSALLAELIQEEMGSFHPGPDRGVRQGPFAVITNALMPSVLVEVGFLTHDEEERLLTEPEFHQSAARAVAEAVDGFFRRYPPAGGARSADGDREGR